MNGKIRVWPRGTNYSNRFCQLIIKITDEYLVFNGYMEDVHIQRLNELLDYTAIQVVNMQQADPRKEAKETVDMWAKEKDIQVYKNPSIFITQIKLDMLDSKKNNKSSLEEDIEI